MSPRTAILTLLLAACAADPDADLRRGRSALDRGDYVGAVEHLEAALAREQTVSARYETLTELGELYLTYDDLRQRERAGELFGHALALAEQQSDDHPVRLDALERMARYHAIEERWVEVRPLLEQYLTLGERAVDPETLYASWAASTLQKAYGELALRKKSDALRARRRDPRYYAQLDRERGDAPPGTQVPEIPVANLCVGPNAHDTSGRPIYVHFTRDDMPLRVWLGDPDTPALDSTPERTRAAAHQGIWTWQRRLRRVLPWFEMRLVEHADDAHVRVEFARRGRYYLPAVGEIALSRGRAVGHVTLAPKPTPSADQRVHTGELMIWARHAFGKALGLVDCWREDSIMSTNWRRAEQFAITDHDVRAFETLLTKRNGAGAATDAVAHEAGVLATVPMINSGDGADLLIDVAARGGRSLPLQLDTGAADTVFTTDYARAVGISVRRIKTNQYRRPSVTGDPLLFWVTAQGGGAESRHFNYALLGGEYLRRYVVDLDFVRRRVRFLDPSIHDLRDDTGRLPGEQLVPLEIRGTLPFVELMLGNGTVRALVDTGWQGAVSITEEKARELGIEINPDAERVKFVNVLGSATALVHELRGARVGDVVLPDTTLLISIRSASDVRIERWVEDETILGLLVLNRYRVRLDYPHGVMGLTPIPPEAGPSRATVPQ